MIRLPRPSALLVALALAAVGSSVIGCTSSSDAPADGGADVTVPSEGGADGAADASTPDAAPADGSVPDSATCGDTKWPAMLAAPMIPLQSIANLDINHGGPGVLPLAYAEQVNCPAIVPLDAGVLAVPGLVYAFWGDDQDVGFYYDPTTGNLTQMIVQSQYTGTILFDSRDGGAYGSHEYAIGMGILLRDGDPMTIDWEDTPSIVANEIFDGMMAAFAPDHPAETDCEDAGDCLVQPDDGSNPSGPGNAFIGVRPLKMYFGTTSGTSVPKVFYTFFGPPDGGQADGG